MALSLVGLFSAVVLIGAVSADEFELSRYTVDGGGAC